MKISHLTKFTSGVKLSLRVPLTNLLMKLIFIGLVDFEPLSNSCIRSMFHYVFLLHHSTRYTTLTEIKIITYSFVEQNKFVSIMQRTMKLILLWGLPCFICQCVYKIWWYVSGVSQIPYYGEVYASSIILCTLELCSWFYRTSIFFLVCVLFRLIGYLQIQRLDEFAPVFQRETEVGTILLEHLRIRRNLRVISHRFRAFILSSLLLVTASQLIFLLMVIKPHADVDILKGGELGVNLHSFFHLRNVKFFRSFAQNIDYIQTLEMSK